MWKHLGEMLNCKRNRLSYALCCLNLFRLGFFSVFFYNNAEIKRKYNKIGFFNNLKVFLNPLHINNYGWTFGGVWGDWRWYFCSRFCEVSFDFLSFEGICCSAGHFEPPSRNRRPGVMMNQQKSLKRYVKFYPVQVI